MPLPVIAGALRITVSGQCLGGGRWSNTWHAQQATPSGWDLAEITGFNDTFRQLYVGPALGGNDSIKAFCPAGTTFDKIQYTPLDGSSGAFEFPLTQVGANGTAGVPAEVSFVITLRSAARGRQNRGRVYLPPFATSVISTTGHLDGPSSVQIVGQATAVQNELITAGSPLAVGSYGPYKDPITHLLVAGTPHTSIITTFSMDLLGDVQRSRKT